MVRSGAIDPLSITVLPFENLSADKESEFSSDRVSEEDLESLARINGMFVVGRTRRQREARWRAGAHHCATAACIGRPAAVVANLRSSPEGHARGLATARKRRILCP
jgi:hypothetical protein